MSRTDQILQALAQAEIAIQNAKQLVGCPPDASQPRQAAPGPQRTPAKAPPPSQAVQKVAAAFQGSAGSADFPALKTDVQFREVWTIQHKDGPFEASKARINFPAHAVPEIGGSVRPRPYFTAGPKLPDSLKPLYAKYATATWGQLFAEALAGDPAGLEFITKDKFWSVSTFENQRYASKVWQQAAALLTLAREAAPEPGTDADAGEGAEDAGDELDF